MSWVTVGVAAVSAISAAKNAEAKREQQNRMNAGQAELTRYSPWTGMKGQLDASYTPGGMEAGIAGGIKGVGMGQSINSAFAPKEGLGVQQPNQDAGTGYLGANTQFEQPQQQPQWGALSSNTFFGKKQGT